MNRDPFLFDETILAAAVLLGLYAVLLLGLLVLLDLRAGSPVDSSDEGAPLRPPVTPLMDPLAFGVSARGGRTPKAGGRTLDGVERSALSVALMKRDPVVINSHAN